MGTFYILGGATIQELLTHFFQHFDPTLAFVMGASGTGIASLILSYIKLRRLRHQAAQFRMEAVQEQTSSRLRLQLAEEQLGEARHLINHHQAQLDSLKTQLIQECTARAVAQEKAERLHSLEENLSQERETITYLQNRNTELEVLIEQERKSSQAKLDLLEEARAQLGDAFKALSSEALKSNNQSFLDLAKTTLQTFQEGAKTDLLHRQQAIQDLLTPVKEGLTQVDAKIQDLEKARLGAYEVLKQQVGDLINSQKDLRLETANLVKALRAPAVRGRWGEIQLRRVVEMAGMIAHCDFMEQVSMEAEVGRLRPDMVVNLPGDKKIVVDAKAPLAAYLDAIETTDESTRLDRLKDHARLVRSHISGLSKRAYWEQFQPAPDFVIMFLPGETFFSAALEQDPSLIEAGVQEKVLIATPTTLIALLRAVSFGWRQEHLAENAREISELGRLLYKRLADMNGHMAKLGRQISSVVESYNQSVGTLERRVLVSARRFKELGASTAEVEIGEIVQISQTPRQPLLTDLEASE